MASNTLTLYQTTKSWTWLKRKYYFFADDKLNVTEKSKFVLGTAENIVGKVENIVGKGENAGYQHFLLLPAFSPYTTMLSKGFICIVFRSRDCAVNG